MIWTRYNQILLTPLILSTPLDNNGNQNDKDDQDDQDDQDDYDNQDHQDHQINQDHQDGKTYQEDQYLLCEQCKIVGLW